MKGKDPSLRLKRIDPDGTVRDPTPEEIAEDDAYTQRVIDSANGKKQCKSLFPGNRLVRERYRCDKFEGHEGKHAWAELEWD